MSSKRYNAKCIVCQKEFVAKKKGTRFCSNVCRAQYSRDNRLRLIQSQRNVIRSQAGVMKAVMPAFVKPAAVMVEKVSEKVGKDLTECKRPDGDHLYTEKDLWILIARIVKIVFEHDGNDLMQDVKAHSLIKDFEKRFKCRFDDVKSSHPSVRPGKTDAENERLIVEYVSLQYSR